jgi:PAS domain S-box-containing protein
MTSSDQVGMAASGHPTADRVAALPWPPSSCLPASGERRALEVLLSLGVFVEAVEEYAIVSLDRTGAVRTWNVGASRIKGYLQDEILGRHFSVFHLPEDRRAGVPDEELSHAVADGHWAGEGWRVRKDGTTFWANVVITAVFDHDGGLAGFINVTRDDTDRRIAEATARELDLMVERERIAIELTDTTVRDMFSVVLALDGALTMNADPHVAGRIRDALTTLDDILRHIRTSLAGHHLAPQAQPPASATPWSLPHQRTARENGAGP